MKKEKSMKEGNPAWFINTARTLESDGNICAAKSWLLTAKTLFPKNFKIQVELNYCIINVNYVCS